MVKIILTIVLCLISGIAFAAPAQVPQVVITEVLVVFNPDTLFIKGRNFGNGSTPAITLGEHPETLAIISASETEIVAECPPDTQQIPTCFDGDYLLIVSVGKGIMDNDVYPLTIGAVGPQGEKGDQGEAGPPGENVYLSSRCSYNEALTGFTSSGGLECRSLRDWDQDRYTVGEGDCDDFNGLRNPGNVIYEYEDYETYPSDGTFDYDCNGVEDKAWPSKMKKNTYPGACSDGWDGNVPYCGQTGTYKEVKRCGTFNVGCCVDKTYQQTQGCI